MSDRALLTQAEALGIQTRWIDADGRSQEVAFDALRALIDAMGSNVESATSREAALPPLITASFGRPIRLDAGALGAERSYRIDLEHGGSLEGRWRADDDRMLPAIRHAGYHRVEIGGHVSIVAVAPARCFLPNDLAPSRAKRWGLAAQTYSLRRDGDGGLGDFGALAELASAAAPTGADTIAISPVHAMFSAAPERRSPYSPSSRRFLNVLMIDPGERFDADEIAAAAIETGLPREPFLDAASTIDWPAAAARKLALLRRLHANTTHGGNGAMKTSLAAFRERGGEPLRRHAAFEALHARFTNEPPWPDDAVADEREIDFHTFLQWLAERGIERAQRVARDSGMAIGLIGDLAVGSDPAGSDAWSLGGELLRGVTIGAPPDYFNARGQDWGLTTFSPFALRASGYRSFIEVLRATMRHCGGVRIDHVMSLMRLWLVPRGGTPLDGAYLSYPLGDLLRLVALESRRHRCLVIGEDLGVVPEGFRDRLRRAGILGLDVLWFMRNGRFLSPHRWRRRAVAMTTTHDLPTLTGWWRGLDIDLRERLGLIGQSVAESERANRWQERASLAQAIRAALAGSSLAADSDASSFVADAIAFVGATRCALALLPLEDALGLSEQPNLPSTIDTHPNWCRRMPIAVAHMLEGDAARRLRRLAESRAAS